MNALGLMVKLSGRPWWQARYRDGKVVSEWERVPGVSRLGSVPRAEIWGKSQWGDLKKAGMVGLRLLTPEGMAVELEAQGPGGKLLEGRFIQLRQTAKDFRFMGGPATDKRYLVFNLIGVVGDDGVTECRSYETEPHAFSLDFSSMLCATCRLPREECGGRDVIATKREELVEWAPNPAFPQAVNRTILTHTDLHGKRRPLIAFKDSVYNMRYRGLGALNLEVQGVRL